MDKHERKNQLNRESRWRHRDHANEKCMEWYYNNKDRQQRFKREYNARISKLWGSLGLQHKWNDVIVGQSEEYVASEILPKLGFTDILWTRPHQSRFFFDILAKDKEGRICGFDVKLGLHYEIPKGRVILIQFLGIRHFIVHVNRALDFHYMREMFGERSCSAVKEFVRFIKNKEMN